ncbi:phosphatase PAP2 family protein [[Mycobacterium] crassicus]|uniref:Phosphatase PAP2 family protein n=1 Tax=[Mycobacterium] crassicus TaxID=2872309 RepID=A0ABU5XIF0_9MYCO|nr:phosphatase PAP2 family protein [Mycolicibacter sp. MYC098]MEB3022024.1 phosphatase PAP2 family protein [Mycolicibacter sp. MYC098]
MATLILGWAVGRGSTTFDSWFSRNIHDVLGEQPRWLLIFTSGWLVLAVLVACLAVTLRRRQWALAAAVLAVPFLVTTVSQGLKVLFDRRNGPYLEYPSGHTALLVAALGMMVVVAAARLWTLGLAMMLSGLGMLGLVACGYHYLTDTIGAAMLATSLVCAAARLTSAL